MAEEMREPIRISIDRDESEEPELFICPKAEGCSQDNCSHKNPHKKIAHEIGLNNCDRMGKCGGMTICIPYKEPAQTPAPEETGLYICPNVGCKTACPYCNGDGKIQYGIDELEFI